MQSQLDPLAPIVVFDIEASNLKANLGHVFCVGYQTITGNTLGPVTMLSIRDYKREFKAKPWDDHRLLEDMYDVLSAGGVWTGYYSDNFDIPYLQARMLKHGIGILPPVAQVDMYKIAKKYLPLHSRRLDSVARFLGCPYQKTPLELEIWEEAAHGNSAMIARIEEHCAADIKVSTWVYLKTRGLDQRAPVRTRLPLGTACNRCGAPREKLQARGFEYSRAIAWQRFQCTNTTNSIPCGAWGRIRVTNKAAA